MATQQYFKYSFKLTGSGGTYTLGLKISGPARGYIVTETNDGGGDNLTQIGDIPNDDYDLIDSQGGANINYKGIFVASSADRTGFVGQYNGRQGSPAAPGDKFLYTNKTTYATGDTVSGFTSRSFAFPCYVTGTLIRTVSGDVAVEALAIGDHVVTASGAERPIKWIGRRSYAARFANANADALPITFKAGSLADGVPARDLSVSPKHAMFLDGVLIQAQDLVNGVSVTRAERIVDEVTYWHVELDSHDVLVAEGAASESFVDDDSRAMFHNAAEFADVYPDEAPAEAVYCAPRVSDGYTLEAVRRGIADRAGLGAPSDKTGRLLGAIDRFDGVTLSGWAMSEAHPNAPVCLDVVIDGVVVGRTLANRAQKCRAACGFEWRMPASRRTTGAVAIEVRRSVDGLALASLATDDILRASAAA